MNIFVRNVMFAFYLLVLLILSGCAGLGPVYEKIEMVPQGKGLVYIYRPSNFIGGGSWYKVKVGETPITTLHNGGYYPYFSDPGKVEFWAKTETKSAVTLDIEANETYYVKGTIGMGLFLARPDLSVVTNEIGSHEITGCKLISDK